MTICRWDSAGYCGRTLTPCREANDKEALFHQYANVHTLFNSLQIGRFEGGDSMSVDELEVLVRLEVSNNMMIAQGMDYHQRQKESRTQDSVGPLPQGKGWPAMPKMMTPTNLRPDSAREKKSACAVHFLSVSFLTLPPGEFFDARNDKARSKPG